MRLENNTVFADEGKILVSKYRIGELIKLGTFSKIENGKEVSFENKLEDIKEYYSVNIDGLSYFVESTTYPEMVTELIRKKYSLDDELAMLANYRLGDYDEELENEFQRWRVLCKRTAKVVLG